MVRREGRFCVLCEIHPSANTCWQTRAAGSLVAGCYHVCACATPLVQVRMAAPEGEGRSNASAGKKAVSRMMAASGKQGA